jgi:hypothetical protein
VRSLKPMDNANLCHLAERKFHIHPESRKFLPHMRLAHAVHMSVFAALPRDEEFMRRRHGRLEIDRLEMDWLFTFAASWTAHHRPSQCVRFGPQFPLCDEANLTDGLPLP